jgi:hypothetical protein
MSNKKDKITEKDLMIFSKKELIKAILQSSWIFNSEGLSRQVEILFKNRIEANYDLVEKTLDQNESLCEQIHNGMDTDVFLKVHESLNKNNKRIDRIYAENKKIEKILYGDISMED